MIVDLEFLVPYLFSINFQVMIYIYIIIKGYDVDLIISRTSQLGCERLVMVGDITHQLRQPPQITFDVSPLQLYTIHYKKKDKILKK